MNEVWLTEKYYREFHQRKGTNFLDSEAGQLYGLTQELQRNWPKCLSQVVPPEIGTKHGLHYLKCDFPSGAVFRVAFGVHQFKGVTRIVAVTCRTKQELAKGNKSADLEWYRHMGAVGRDCWNDYLRGTIKAWKIY